ncbi:DUF2971 domain-containing protein [Metabacillus fastidiosus]|uniref:DUF2971 domain-containing protein n=1 Tax=Metabacillus fastidiosus TaxID=1458 RepID=UPI003D2D03B2
MKQWLKEYIDLFFKDRDRGYEFKHQHIPKKLYKYQPISDGIRDIRMETLKDNKFWLSKSTELNDPFDCQATYFDEKELRVLIEKMRGNGEINISTDKLLNGIKQMLIYNRENVKVVCFTESPDNMPMWGNYADNHRGICVEYEFNKLEPNNKFTKMLHPVGYDKYRYDITNILKKMIMENYDHTIYLIFFLMMMKHDSWEYEQEWRVLDFDEASNSEKGSLIESPIKPSAIYFGINCCPKDIEEITSFVDRDITKLYQLKIENHQFFQFDLIE